MIREDWPWLAGVMVIVVVLAVDGGTGVFTDLAGEVFRWLLGRGL